MAILVYGSGGGSGNDISDTTAIQGDVLPGKYFYLADGTKVEGSMATKAAATIVPSTSDQTINANQYLLGAQTIQGNANLISGNIKNGVNIFGVNGTLVSRNTRVYFKSSNSAGYPNGWSDTITVAANFKPVMVELSVSNEASSPKDITQAVWYSAPANGYIPSGAYDKGFTYLSSLDLRSLVDAGKITFTWSLSGTTLSFSFAKSSSSFDFYQEWYDVIIAGYYES